MIPLHERQVQQETSFTRTLHVGFVSPSESQPPYSLKNISGKIIHPIFIKHESSFAPGLRTLPPAYSKFPPFWIDDIWDSRAICERSPSLWYLRKVAQKFAQIVPRCSRNERIAKRRRRPLLLLQTIFARFAQQTVTCRELIDLQRPTACVTRQALGVVLVGRASLLHISPGAQEVMKVWCLV